MTRRILLAVVAALLYSAGAVAQESEISANSPPTGSETAAAGSRQFEEALPKEVRALMRRHRVSPRYTGIVVWREGDDEPLVWHQAEKSFNPASLVKLPLAAAAADILGNAHVWETAFAADGPPSADGVLDGDLYLVGGGDPYVTFERFLLFVHDLRERGVRVIRGDLVVDTSFFEATAHDPAAFDGKRLKPYNASGGAAAVNFNAQRIDVRPRYDGVHAAVSPPNDNLVVKNGVQEGRIYCANWRRRVRENYSGDQLRTTLSLSGKFSPKCGEQSFYVSALSPEANAAGVFGAAWRRMGGEWDGSWRVGRTPASAVTLAAFESPPLPAVLAAMNKFSNNVIARNIFLSLPAEPPRTLQSARAALSLWMLGQGVHGEFFVDNGSGLSRDARMSAAQLARVLHAVSAHPLRAEIVSSLPVLGIDGTLKRRLQKDGAGDGHLKTGSLSGIANIAGFVRDQEGRRLIFVCLNERTASGRAKAFQDSLMHWARRL